MELDLDTHVPAADPAPAPAAEPVAEPIAAATEPEPEPIAEHVAEPEPVVVAADPKPAKKGLLEEMIEHRTARKQAEARVHQYEQDPVLQRLTPEIRQAIADGRIVVKPPQSNADTERERLSAQANRFGLFLADGTTPDIEAARRVDTAIRETVREEVAPIKEQAQASRVLTMQDKANKNLSDLWAKAAADGMAPEVMEIARKEFDVAMAMPNAAAVLAQAEVVDTIYERALGKAYRAGVLKVAAPVKPAKPATPAIVAEPAGRRGPASAAIQLSPAMQAVYRNAGIDPAATAAKPPTVDSRGHMELE